MCSGESKARAQELLAGIPTAGASNNPKGCFKNMGFAELCTSSSWLLPAHWDSGGSQLAGAEMCSNSVGPAVLSDVTLQIHCKTQHGASDCAGLGVSDPGLPSEPCPTWEVSGVWCPAGQGRAAQGSWHRVRLGLVHRSLSMVAMSLHLRWLWEPGAFLSPTPASGCLLAVANNHSPPSC